MARATEDPCSKLSRALTAVTRLLLHSNSSVLIPVVESDPSINILTAVLVQETGTGVGTREGLDVGIVVVGLTVAAVEGNVVAFNVG